MHSQARLNCPDGDRRPCFLLSRLAICFATALLLAGCATEEKLAVKGECQSEAYGLYPVKMETYVITKTRSVEVPDGTISCTTVGSGDYKRTDCREGKKYVDEKYQVEEARDSNSSLRSTYIDRCTSQRCAQRYGNSGCKVEAPKAPVVRRPMDVAALQPDRARQVLERYFGAEWVSQPYGHYLLLGGQICGDKGKDPLPFSEIEGMIVSPGQDMVRVELIKTNLTKIWGPCGQLSYVIQGDLSQSDVDSIAAALKSLGAKL